ncbi:MAG: membrane protein insertase YidC [Granulosicoccus sp.]
METQRLLLYMALGFLSLIIYQTWMQDYHTPVVTTRAADSAVTDGSDAQPGVAAAPSADDLPQGPSGGESTSSVATSAEASTSPAVAAPIVSVTTDVMNVSIDTVGATITGVELLDYSVSIDDQETPFSLMSSDPGKFLVAESGLQSRAGEPAPTHREPMTAEATSYVMDESGNKLAVPFVWVSADGVKVTKTLTFTRGSYEVAVEYLIENGSDAEWTANQYRQLKRKPGTKDEKQQFVNTYIGAVVSNPEDRYAKVKFTDMEDENLDVSVTDGWVAMIQHYFAAAWIPNAQEVNTAYSRHLSNENRYLIGMVSASQVIPAGGQGTFSTSAYIGPKIQETLKAAAPHLELTVDYGWLTIIAQPLFWLLKTIHSFVGNWGWAIVGVTICVKALFYKLSEASYKSMARMKLLQPKLASLKERYGDDRAKMGQATMELYKKEKVNPLGGCLPMIIQIPVFIALYWTLLESVELRQAPWMLWIKDLSIRDPYFILPVIMAVTMFFQQKLNPAPVDPIQAKVFQFLPLIFGVFFAFFPAGLVLYWVVNNSLTIAQQYYITRHVLADKAAGKKS